VHSRIRLRAAIDWFHQILREPDTARATWRWLVREQRAAGLQTQGRLLTRRCQLVRSDEWRRSSSAVEEGTVGSARVVQAAVVSPVTSFQILKRLAISLRYSWAWSR
jgi:hypothetical protein